MVFLYEWVKNIVIYLILITVVMNLLGKSSYKKYIGIFTGMILVILILSPIIKLFNVEDSFSHYFDVNNFIVEAEDISNRLVEVEEGRNKFVIEEYKEKIKDQIRQIAEGENMFLMNSDIDIYDNREDENYGKIKSIELYLSYFRESEVDEIKRQNRNRVVIENIKIDNIKETENTMDKEEVKDNVLSISEIELKKAIADFYNIPKDNINISIQD